MYYIEYKTIDLDKIKTVDDIVLILKSHPQFVNYKCAKSEEWQTLGHLLSDETFREVTGEEE